MEAYIERIRKALTSDQAPRVLLLGSAAVLTIVVLSDLFGARDRAPEVREILRTVQAEREGAPTVPSVASVPRDLASEVLLAARDTKGAAQPVADIAEAEMPDDAADEIAEAEPTEAAVDDIAEAEVIAPATEEVAEAEATDAAAEEIAEAEATDAAAEEIAEAEAIDAAAEEIAEAEAIDTATEELAEAEATDTATEEMAEAEATEEITAGSADKGDLGLLASADLANGQRVWRQCGACHIHDAEQNRGGPHLVNIVGRDIGAAEGWRYSRALSEHGGVWTVESLLAWLENPDAYIPGNQMAFRGLRNEQDRIDILGFLNANRVE